MSLARAGDQVRGAKRSLEPAPPERWIVAEALARFIADQMLKALVSAGALPGVQCRFSDEVCGYPELRRNESGGQNWP